jgi:hypothetical protein
VFLAHSYDQNVLNFLYTNKTKNQGLSFCAVEFPFRHGLGDRDRFGDLMTVGSDFGFTIEDCLPMGDLIKSPERLLTFSDVDIDRNRTIFSFPKNRDNLKLRALRESLESELSSLARKEGETGLDDNATMALLKRRLASISVDGCANILVGGVTAVGRRNIVTVIEDSVYAAKSALTMGALRAGYLDSLQTVAIASTDKAIKISSLKSFDREVLAAVAAAFLYAYKEYVVTLLGEEGLNTANLDGRMCYDIRTGKISPRSEATVLNPAETEIQTFLAIAEVVAVLFRISATLLARQTATDEEAL